MLKIARLAIYINCVLHSHILLKPAYQKWVFNIYVFNHMVNTHEKEEVEVKSTDPNGTWIAFQRSKQYDNTSNISSVKVLSEHSLHVLLNFCLWTPRYHFQRLRFNAVKHLSPSKFEYTTPIDLGNIVLKILSRVQLTTSVNIQKSIFRVLNSNPMKLYNAAANSS
ncbi:unnamed protein product [Ambrosiozyma monospora]|uniref:Unnamed protein product n=1 Tax=Ambrosiozyma monospora TaxID=43982 RepID=A0ACB5T2E3_AMBMO|nr:unnamed protein product [Ambrosiozyma monospora]